MSQIHPVLDHANRPLLEPTPFHINTSIQRCLVKAIALHGLGLYVYAGEDLPDGEPKPLKHSPTGTPVVAKDREAIIDATVWAIKDHFATNDIVGAYEDYIGITDDDEKIALWKLLPSHMRSAIKKHGETLKETV